MPKFDVQPKEAQLIFDQLRKHLRDGLMLKLMPKLEAQVIIGFLKKLKAAAEYQEPKRIKLSVIREEPAQPEPARREPSGEATAPTSPSPSGLDPRSGRRFPGGQPSS